MTLDKTWCENNRDHELIYAFLFGIPPFSGQPYKYDGFYESCRQILRDRGLLTERQTETVRKQMNGVLGKDPKDSSPFFD